MSGEAILTVSAAVTGLTQLLKLLFGIEKEEYRGLTVVATSVLGVAFWGFSQGDVTRASLFGYFAGLIAVMTSAAGVFGIVNSAQKVINQRSQQP